VSYAVKFAELLRLLVEASRTDSAVALAGAALSGRGHHDFRHATIEFVADICALAVVIDLAARLPLAAAIAAERILGINQATDRELLRAEAAHF
jgi:hypothetical protein